MPNIRSLFHPDLPIDRRIEKVITFSNREPEILLGEAREYVVTKNLGSEFQKLLNYFDDAQQGDRGQAECCAWLSGFYGSGKSSFAKYFGLSFDPTATTPEGHFSEVFVPRFPETTQQTRFKKVAKDFDVTVFLLDLAAQGVAGVTHTPISTQLYNQVCHWSGKPSDAKIAQFEAKLDLDGKLDEYRDKLFQASGMPYDQLLNLPALMLPSVSRLAHAYYPNLYPNDEALQNSRLVVAQTEQDRVKEMLDLIEKNSGTKRVLFIVDEVGHFLQNNQSLTANLDGLAKNLKEIGEGRAWLIATAQETLPNSGPLFGLRDRFPIKIDLKPSDIREITHKRLLRKSAASIDELKCQYASSGQKLTLLTQLEDYKTDRQLDEESFVEFYPLLPQQFDILIDAIRSLAKQQGGVGLRSAIRCVQDLLIGRLPGEPALVDRDVPCLTTIADFYDVLESDMAFRAKDILLNVNRIAQSYGENSWEHKIAKAVGLLQQIDGFPINRHNITALLYPEVGAESISDSVETAIDVLLSDNLVPIGETDGRIEFQSEAVNKIDREKDSIVVTGTHRMAIQNKLLGELFQKPPTVKIENAKTIKGGLTFIDGGREHSITDKGADLRFFLRLVSESDLEKHKNDYATNESLAESNKAKIYIIAPMPSDLDATLGEIHKAREISKSYQHKTEPEISRYVSGQEQFARQKEREVQQFLTQAITRGWIIFQGNPQAASTLGSEWDSVLRNQLSTSAEVVFHKFKLAPENVKAKVAEDFLRCNDLQQITQDRDPLSLVKIQGTDTQVNIDHPALKEILEFLDKHPTPEGKRVLEEFVNAPWGWSKETTRYLVAALFYAQRIKIRTGSEELSVLGEKAFAAFKTSTSFNSVVIIPNLDDIPDDVRQRAAQRLTDLTGATVLPLPQKIAEVAVKNIPQFVQEFAQLPRRAADIGLPQERFDQLQRGLTNALVGDGSEAPNIFGKEKSTLYDDITWARKVATALNNGAEDTIKEINGLIDKADRLSAQGVAIELPHRLRATGEETLASVENGTFYDDIPALGKTLDDMQSRVSGDCQEEVEGMQDNFSAQVKSLQQSADYQKLSADQKKAADSKLERLVFAPEPSLEGLQRAGSEMMQVTTGLQAVRESIQEQSKPEPTAKVAEDGEKIVSVCLSQIINDTVELDQAIEALNESRDELVAGKSIRIELAD